MLKSLYPTVHVQVEMRRRKISLCVLYVKLRKRDYSVLAETEGGRVGMRQRGDGRQVKLRRREDPSGVRVEMRRIEDRAQVEMRVGWQR
jgi:hypothetical protein